MEEKLKEAQALIEQEKQSRAEQFAKELDELLKKHNCTLIQGGISIKPN